jgi:hypothetical protein
MFSVFFLVVSIFVFSLRRAGMCSGWSNYHLDGHLTVSFLPSEGKACWLFVLPDVPKTFHCSRISELARVLVRFDHIAHFTRSAAKL